MTPFVVGITGPAGAGKSTVAALIAASGFPPCGAGVSPPVCNRMPHGGGPILDADKIAREITVPGSPVLAELKSAFGAGILEEDGSLNRRALAAAAFADPAAKRELERITHPRILAEFERRLAELRSSGIPFAVIDAPLLFESGSERMCGTTVAVLCGEEERLRRVMLRDGRTPEQTLNILRAQPPESYYTARAAHILRSDGGLAALTRDAAALLKKLRGEIDETPG